ncbi:MAG: type II toxin-antitoxin system HicB family antitoxin [Micavibrio aeruginosavorus]|nr:type II toxin-antitoxin system HicB family antitoxin [Micavibrio aeruginosavorus]
MDYIAYLYKEADSDFGVSFPDFPGCITAGKTLEEAKTMAQEALQFHIEGMVSDGAEIPPPSFLDDLKDDPDMKDAVCFLVSISGKKVVRVNITMTEDKLSEIDKRAKAEGKTRSAYMVDSSL